MSKQKSRLQDNLIGIMAQGDSEPPEQLPVAPPQVQAEIEYLREQIAYHARKGRTTFHSERLAQILLLYSEG